MRASVVLLVLIVLTAPIWDGHPSSNAYALETSVLTEGLVIYEVSPAKPVEFVSLMNSGNCSVDTSGYSLSDGEGTLTLPTMTLAPGDTMTIIKEMTALPSISSKDILVHYSDPSMLRKGSFALNDAGDQLTLIKGGSIVDVFCYGEANTTGGWEGPTFKFMDKAHIALRSDMGRSKFCSEIWSSSVVGRMTSVPFICDAPVAPLIHPDDGDSAIIGLIGSSSSVRVCVYTLESIDIALALASASRAGCDVKVLLEGQPVGGLSIFGKRAIVTLLEAGVEVSTFRSNDSFRRYEYIHAKYAVFDSRYISISSENWGSGMVENRGWGVIIDSTGLASHMNQIFDRDSDLRYGDVTVVDEMDAYPFTPNEGETTWNVPSIDIDANITVIASPGGSLKAVIDMISSAKGTICIEAMSMDYEWMECSGLLSAIVSSAKRGVEIRILLDRANQFDENSYSAVRMTSSYEGLPIECKLISPYHEIASIHNKGIIVDDTVLVSSINLVPYAFKENLEVGVIIRSAEIAKTYRSYFISDWEDDSEAPTIILSGLDGRWEEGRSVMIDASASYDNSGEMNISWDLDCDGAFDAEGPVLVIKMRAGTHSITVRATDAHGNVAEEIITIDVESARILPVPELLLAAPAAFLASLLAYRVLQKRIKSR